jgi:hypothetical protein
MTLLRRLCVEPTSRNSSETCFQALASVRVLVQALASVRVHRLFDEIECRYGESRFLQTDARCRAVEPRHALPTSHILFEAVQAARAGEFHHHAAIDVVHDP